MNACVTSSRQGDASPPRAVVVRVDAARYNATVRPASVGDPAMPPEPPAIRRLVIGCVIAVAMGLLATAWGVFSPKVLDHYSDSPDSVGITQWAERATGGDMLRWLAGRWILLASLRPLNRYLAISARRDSSSPSNSWVPWSQLSRLASVQRPRPLSRRPEAFCKSPRSRATRPSSCKL